MVARLNGVQEAAGSNPVTRTKKETCVSMSLFWPEFSAALRRKYPLRSIFLGGDNQSPPKPAPCRLMSACQRPLAIITRPPCGRRAAFTAADGRWFKSSHSDQKRDMRKHVSFLVRVQRRFAAQISVSLKLLGREGIISSLQNLPHAGFMPRPGGLICVAEVGYSSGMISLPPMAS